MLARLILYLNFIQICFILPIIVKSFPLLAKIYKRWYRLKTHLFLRREWKRLYSIRGAILEAGKGRSKVKMEDLGLTPENLQRLKEEQKKSAEVVIAEIDWSGSFLSNFGPLENLPMTTKADFKVRKKWRVEVISLNGYIGIKKHYGNNLLAFLCELNALHKLRQAGCNVPAIMDIDFEKSTLTISFVLGISLYQLIEKKFPLPEGYLKIREKKENGGKGDEWLQQVREDKRFIYDILDRDFTRALFEQVQKVHRVGFFWSDLKYSNIMLERPSFKPYLIDFNTTFELSVISRDFLRIIQDLDFEHLNSNFGTDFPTFKRLRDRIRARKSQSEKECGEAGYFGFGLRMGRMRDLKSGYVCWKHILKGNLPELAGKRILVIGANNGFTALQFLRYGASEVVGIENDERFIRESELVRLIFEWIESGKLNFSYINSNLQDIGQLNLGRFDIAYAQGSDNYSTQNKIKQVIDAVSRIAHSFIFSVGTGKGGKGSGKENCGKTLIECCLCELRNSGFSDIKVLRSTHYPQAFIIANKKERISNVQ